MGHIGLTPQSVNQLGGYRVQGKTPKAAAQLLRDALALEEAGAFAIVLECVPTPLAQLITHRCTVPTIGIGAGPYCDGQVQVLHDMLGLFQDFSPKHAKKYAHLAEAISEAVSTYATEVKEGDFPTEEHSFTMDPGVLSELIQAV
jgi:3-methyl-2-oxobutanoate hydroxymethyltransferase